MRTLWSRYYEETNAVVWVVDAQDFANLAEGRLADKGKATGPGYDADAEQRREDNWNILCKLARSHAKLIVQHLKSCPLFAADLLTHPSLEGRPILLVANKFDQNSSSSMSLEPDARQRLTQNVRSWFQHKLAQMDQDTPADKRTETKRLPNIFADTDEAGDLGATRSKPTLRTLTGASDYEWDVITTSAIDG